MATQYTSILKLALPVQGELSGTWGDVVNDNITSMVEEAIAGLTTIDTWTTNSHTMTEADGTTSEARAAIVHLTDTGVALSGAGTLICPNSSKLYVVKNSTGQTITVKTAAGTGVAILDGATNYVLCDGTNVEPCVTAVTDLTVDDTLTANTLTATTASAGTATVTNAMTAGSIVKSGGTSSEFLKADGSVDSSTYATTQLSNDTAVAFAIALG